MDLVGVEFWLRGTKVLAVCVCVCAFLLMDAFTWVGWLTAGGKWRDTYAVFDVLGVSHSSVRLLCLLRLHWMRYLDKGKTYVELCVTCTV